MRYLHLRKRVNGTPKAKGGKTVAYEVTGNLLTLAYAKCSKKDSYCKKTGRDIATGRYLRAFRSGTGDVHTAVMVLQPDDKPIEAIIRRVG